MSKWRKTTTTGTGNVRPIKDNGETLLTGPVIDQAALYGLLKKVRDLGMPLISVNRVEPGPSTMIGTGQADASDVKQ